MVAAVVGHIRIAAVVAARTSVVSTMVVASSTVAEARIASVSSARTTLSVSVVTAVESVAHATVSTTISVSTSCKVTSVIPAASAVVSPTVTSTIDGPEVGASEVEVVAVWVAGIDAEMPVSSVPIERAIEIGGSQIGFILPLEQDIAQVKVALCPVDSVEVCLGVDAHQVVEVDLVCGLVLLLGEVEFIGHLVSKEQSLLAGLLVTHCACRQCDGQQCCHGYQNSFHFRMVLFVRNVLSCSHDAKKRTFPNMLKGFSLH